MRHSIAVGNSHRNAVLMEVFVFTALHGFKNMVVSLSQVLSMVMVRPVSDSCGAEWRVASLSFVQEGRARRERVIVRSRKCLIDIVLVCLNAL